MKLRTFDGEPVRGKMTTDSLVSPDGGPVLLINDEPFSQDEGDEEGEEDEDIESDED